MKHLPDVEDFLLLVSLIRNFGVVSKACKIIKNTCAYQVVDNL
jgi:hypothetical protein